MEVVVVDMVFVVGSSKERQYICLVEYTVNLRRRGYKQHSSGFKRSW